MNPRRILITGGAGFVGINLADHFISRGHHVLVLDNFYRAGSRDNLRWLEGRFGDGFELIEADVRDPGTLQHACKGTDAVFHLAGQTAVTTSVADPRADFEINALGTFNVLEAARLSGRNPVLIFTSTNKVYGDLESVPYAEHSTRYTYSDNRNGIDESQPLDFHSPYGCSKGAADQYVRDYSRIYGLPTVVFRMSSIYGPHQFGVEDQAWVAHFVISAVTGKPINIYGDGKQVRDVLYVTDLARAFELVTENIETTAGQVYNIGGGSNKALSIWSEFAPLLSKRFSHSVEPSGFYDWRPGDQRIYISEIGKARRDFGWRPLVGVEAGLQELSDWALENQELFRKSERHIRVASQATVAAAE